jgi:hypothetical protein
LHLLELRRSRRQPLLALVDTDRARGLVAEGGSAFIGPSAERWDVVQLVWYPSPQAFMALASNDEVQAGLPHRFAMLEDSRVIPMIERSLR